MKGRILILCTGNSARSQMAEGLMRDKTGDRFEVYSAGTKPSRVRPEAIAVMREIGIDISGHRSKSVEEFQDQESDYMITVCDNANESCPVFPGRTKRLHWPFEDPASVEGSQEEREAVFRKVRDQSASGLMLKWGRRSHSGPVLGLSRVVPCSGILIPGRVAGDLVAPGWSEKTALKLSVSACKTI